MFLRFALFIAVAIIAVQGEVSLSTIESDAGRLTDLFRKYTTHPGAAQMLGSMKQVCPWLIDCCPNEIARFTSLMFENKFFGRCLNSAKTAGGAQCARAPFPAPEQEGEGIDPKARIAQHILPWIKQTEKACSPVELHSFYCQQNNADKFQSCQVKTLQVVARENGDNGYESFVSLLEEDLNAFYNEVIQGQSRQ